MADFFAMQPIRTQKISAFSSLLASALLVLTLQSCGGDSVNLAPDNNSANPAALTEPAAVAATSNGTAASDSTALSTESSAPESLSDTSTETESQESGVIASRQIVSLDTTLGTIEIELDPENAPLTVENFLNYVDDGHYDGTVFHRVIPGFVIQGGGFTSDLTAKPVNDPVRNEAANGLRNDRYTLAMARTSDPHSATSQFYINLNDNEGLNYTAPTFAGFGYTVFGQVIAGQAVVDLIASQPTGPAGRFSSDVPVSTILIRAANRVP